MAGPRGIMHGLGECARVPQFKMMTFQIGSSTLEVRLEVFHPWASTASYLLLPHSHCCGCLLHTGTFMAKSSFPPREGAMGRTRGLAHPSGLLPLVQAPPDTYPGLLCATSVHRADCIYLPLGCLVKEHSHGSLSLLGESARDGMMGQLYQCVWPILLRAGQPHFNSVVNPRGHKCNFLFFFSLGHLKPQ